MGSLRNLRMPPSAVETELEEFLRVFELSGLQEATEMLELLERYMAIGPLDEIQEVFHRAKELVPLLLEYQKLGTPESIKETFDRIIDLVKVNSKRIAKRPKR
jgi:hypothetical protein